ncbi:potassium uptake protein KtrA [Melioribacter roseus P3M-2]|jgi:trk system potassium uptake protein TrkA|uniref:Potassium uptake protein KtrA n=1 Tax=Melioribacter roseus (strain DSM 23840 / JCM 17771 / VKM B-2668 / P3M-2) TaxID=1191523 RepID=I6YV71_MELRP|nr:TrkA family potassium uptake protein [Melioribacter roseus]AFN74432.1 potassium uptake protein KtrA [Melioribacter roseus P3M-2]
MNKKFAVIGLGDFGLSVALSLAEKGAEVIAIDRDMEIIEDIKDKVTYAVRMDSTDEKALRSLGVDKVDAVIISMGTNFEDTILTSVLLLQMKVKKVIARATSKIHEKILTKLGVDQVISPDFEIANKVANTLMSDDILDFVSIGEEYSIFQIRAPKAFIGKSLQEIDLRIRYNLNLITIKREYKVVDEATGEELTKQRIYGVPTSTTIVEENDILVLFGKEKDIKKVID